jgi:tyrosine-specific transport protein
MISKCVLRAIATLVGCTIGAGILGIPYVIAKSGFIISLIDIIIIGLAILLVNLYIGEISLRTNNNHQLCGYAQKYLGKKGKKIMMLTMVFAYFGALLAYTVGSGVVLNSIFSFLNPFYFSLIYLAVMSLIIYYGLKAIEDSEIVLGMIMLAIIAVIIGFALKSSFFDIGNLSYINLAKSILPYGVILFAFLGAPAVPEMKEILYKERKNLKKSIIFGTLISLVIYLAFAFSIVGISGTKTTEVATVGLGEILGLKMILFGNLFALFAMSTSFLVLGLALKEMFNYDYKINKRLSWLITCLIPLVLFISGVNNFIAIIGVVGAVAGGIQSIMIIFMHHNAKKKGDRKPEYSLNNFIPLNIILISLFVLGMIFELLMISGLIN